LFLDFYHVEQVASTRIRKPLVDVLNEALGADDMIAVMTPGMRASELTFTPKRTTVDAILSKVWGERDAFINRDPEDDAYAACYPGVRDTPACRGDIGVADEMIARRREQLTIEALHDLVTYLRGIREERKAVLVITDGWRLFTPNDDLTHTIGCKPADPTGPGIGIDPRNGRLTSAPPDQPMAQSAMCERDRTRLAQLNDEIEAREIGQDANRGNVSFYPIDPRGLAAYDDRNPASLPLVPTPLSPTARTDPREDTARQLARIRGLRALADDTDGVAIVQTGDILTPLRKAVNDLSSYYLLGYATTGKLDGKFHSITVRVKRPGVTVRARRGYLAATAAELSAGRAVPAPPALAGALVADAAAVSASLAALAAAALERPVHLLTASGLKADKTPGVWASVEVSGDAWRTGGDVDFLLTDDNRQTRATAHAQLPAGTRSARVQLTSTEILPSGNYSVIARARPAGSSAATTDTASVAIADSAATSGALFVRRGQTTGNRDVAAADLRFRRTEIVRVEIPTSDTTAPSARLLDRTGKLLQVPVTVAMRDDADGSRWETAQVSLAPLAPGDYEIELTRAAGGTTARTLVAFRLVP